MPFSKDSERRIVKAIRHSELSPKGKTPRGYPSIPVLPLRSAITTSSISARSGLTRGHGTVDLYVDNGSGTHTDMLLQSGLTVENPFSVVIASGRHVWVGIVDGNLYILGGDCG